MQQTKQHFGMVYGLQIPESTIRGLRSQYIKTISNTNEPLHDEKNDCIVNTDDILSTSAFSNELGNKADGRDLSELNYGKRGRPIRLGKVKIDGVS